VHEDRLSLPLCGKSRPGHFRGVCTVVAKLFLILQPDLAIFGEKDWQQLAVIRRMVRDLNFPVKIRSHPTVREKDGLALSSRNTYLTPEERKVAPAIQEILAQCAATSDSPATLLRKARTRMERIPGARVDYLEAVDAETLEPLKSRQRSGRLITAVFLGRTRLLDNVALPFVSPQPSK
jgi:pantoate--beta-alanine ligase